MDKSLPAHPHIDWLKKAAKKRLSELRTNDPSAKLHHAQLELATEYGFKSWRTLKAHVDTASLDGQIISATVNGETDTLDQLCHRGRRSSLLHLRQTMRLAEERLGISKKAQRFPWSRSICPVRSFARIPARHGG